MAELKTTTQKNLKFKGMQFKDGEVFDTETSEVIELVKLVEEYFGDAIFDITINEKNENKVEI